MTESAASLPLEAEASPGSLERHSSRTVPWRLSAFRSAHLHGNAEELFHILDGELGLVAFEPQTGTAGEWQAWQSASGDIQQVSPTTVGRSR